MKKTKLGIGLITSLLAVGALAACSDVHYSNNVILTYTRDGKTIKYTADDLLSDEFKSSDNYQLVFDNIYKVIVKNYFTEVDKDNSAYGKAQLAGLKKKAEEAVKGDKQTAKRRAETNNTSYDTEFDAILSEKGCEDEDELFDHYLYQYEEETFNKNFETSPKNLSILKSGTPDDATNKFQGYFDAKVPYHVSHLLVKIEDSDSDNYADATVSEANAKRLFNVADALAKNDDKDFGATAERLSDDSAARGDLGLVDMDKTATYIDEFKYALYAYENLIGVKEGDKFPARESNIAIDIGEYKGVNHLDEDTLSTEGFSVLPLGAFYQMKEYADKDTGYLGQKVHDGDANFYPRNILFNHFFNRHSFALVSPNKLDANLDVSANVYKAAAKEIVEINDGVTGTGFHTFGASDGLGFTGTYLAAGIKLGNTTVYRPILVVRGGSSGESGYQGVHFIIVNRSRFEFVNGSSTDKSVASLEDYYTTYFPSETNYPTYKDGENTKQLQTYVSSIKKDQQQSRAEEVLSAIKGFNSDGLKHYIFKKYLADGKLSVADYKFNNGKVLSTELNKWMNRSEELKEYEAKVEWENKWTSYIENLNIAVKVQANRAIDKACAINFSVEHSGTTGNKENAADPAAWNVVGGICNNGSAHN